MTNSPLGNAFFLIWRRMRTPLIVLVASYAIALLGLVLIPGVDANGNTTRLSFFHAFYILSYTATTIGFGEVPHAFTNAQRGWMTIAIYLTVIAWLYSIGKVLTLAQDPALRRVFAASAFARRVRAMRSPFYLVCGCGETGGSLIDALDARGWRVTALDINPERVGAVGLANHRRDVPVLEADARLPDALLSAGLQHRFCRGVIGSTSDDQANLAVAVTSKLLRHRLPVLCRTDTAEVARNMASFGTDSIIDPFEVFGEHLAMAMHAPSHYLLYDWLTGVPDTPLEPPMHPPRGKWIVCGYGRFGKAVVRNLEQEGLETVIIEMDPATTGCRECILGRGTEAETLLSAGIREAVGIVAGTNHDIDNLSIVMTARELRPDLFVVLRQNFRANDPLFESFGADITMRPSTILAHEFLARLTTPLLTRFFALSRTYDNDWANELLSRVSAVVGETVPDLWDIEIGTDTESAVSALLASGTAVMLGQLQLQVGRADRRIACFPLLLQRGLDEIVLPADELTLRPGDRLLFCGNRKSRFQQSLVLFNLNALNHLVTDEYLPSGSLRRWLDTRLDGRPRMARVRDVAAPGENT
ncbi:MAG: potassium channel family protein [Thiotrichales bacterium]